MVKKNEIELQWDYPYEIFVWGCPNGKEKLPTGWIPSLSINVCLGLIPTKQRSLPLKDYGEWSQWYENRKKLFTDSVSVNKRYLTGSICE